MPLPGREEYAGFGKVRAARFELDRPGNIKDHIRALNRIRRSNPALQDFRGFLPLASSNDQVLVYARMTPTRDNCVIVLVNLDPYNRQTRNIEIPLWEFDMPDWAPIEAEDLLHGNKFVLYGKTHVIDIDPAQRAGGDLAHCCRPRWRAGA